MSKEAIVISLDEEVACPSDREHRFPLRLGLAESTVRRMQESLSEQIGQAKTEIRAALEQEYKEANIAAVRELESQLVQARASGQEKLEQAIAEADLRLQEERKRWQAEEEKKLFLREQTLREQLGATQKMLEELIQQNATKTKEALALEEQLVRLRLEKDTAIARAVSEVRENTRSEVRVQTEKVLREQFDSERNALRLKQVELEKQRDDARCSVEELRRRMEQGSQQSQGEALELTLEVELLSMFPADRIVAVAKGMNGADILQTVVMSEGRTCGSITWETKNAQNWSTKWVDKLRKDMIANKSEFGVLVTTVLPEEIRHFGQVEGIWVCDISVWKAVAAALRRQILHLAFVRASVEGQERKMNILYQYLTGPQFRERVNAIVQTFVAMQEQLGREKRAMTKQWSVREKQIDLVLDGLSGMYGDLQGIIGEASLPEISPFQLVADENEAET